MDRVRYLSMPQTTPLARLVEQHVAILDAVEARDEAGAEAAVRAHLSEILDLTPAARTDSSRISSTAEN